jgi:hypothetical protein
MHKHKQGWALFFYPARFKSCLFFKFLLIQCSLGLSPPPRCEYNYSNLFIYWTCIIYTYVFAQVQNVCHNVSRVESLSFHMITQLTVCNVPQFIAKLFIPPNYRLHRRWWFNEGALYIKNLVWFNSQDLILFKKYHDLPSTTSCEDATFVFVRKFGTLWVLALR